MTILASAAQVLRCFGGDCVSVTVTDLVLKLGMPKSNASRLLRAMRDAGLLETVGSSKRYRPGLLLLDAGRCYRHSSSLVQRADAVVARVSAECGHTGYVSMMVDSDVAAITDHPGTHALRVVSNIGRRLPAYASATGRTLLARQSDRTIEKLYAQPFKPPTAAAPRDLADLFERLAKIRKDGFASSASEITDGVEAIAVAVGDPETGEAVSLCIVLPAATSDTHQKQDIARSLFEGAAEIAAITGDRQFGAQRT